MQTTLAQLRNALVGEWNNIQRRTVNASVNSILRRISAAAAAKRGAHEILSTEVNFDFQL